MPGADLRIAAVRPAVSTASGAGAAATAVDATGGHDLVVAMPGWLAGINLVLGLFILEPGG